MFNVTHLSKVLFESSSLKEVFYYYNKLEDTTDVFLDATTINDSEMLIYSIVCHMIGVDFELIIPVLDEDKWEQIDFILTECTLVNEKYGAKLYLYDDELTVYYLINNEDVYVISVEGKLEEEYSSENSAPSVNENKTAKVSVNTDVVVGDKDEFIEKMQIKFIHIEFTTEKSYYILKMVAHKLLSKDEIINTIKDRENLSIDIKQYKEQGVVFEYFDLFEEMYMNSEKYDLYNFIYSETNEYDNEFYDWYSCNQDLRIPNDVYYSLEKRINIERILLDNNIKVITECVDGSQMLKIDVKELKIFLDKLEKEKKHLSKYFKIEEFYKNSDKLDGFVYLL